MEHHVSDASANLPRSAKTTRHEIVILQERLLFCVESNDLRYLRNIAFDLHAATVVNQTLAIPQQLKNASNCLAN